MEKTDDETAMKVDQGGEGKTKAGSNEQPAAADTKKSATESLLLARVAAEEVGAELPADEPESTSSRPDESSVVGSSCSSLIMVIS